MQEIAVLLYAQNTESRNSSVYTVTGYTLDNLGSIHPTPFLMGTKGSFPMKGEA
jgi:hypothetical protein